MMQIKSAIGQKFLKQLIFVAVLLLLTYLVVGTGLIGSYPSSLLSLSFIYIIAALGVNLVTGMTGQLMLGQAGFMSIGAYGAAILMKSYSVPIVPALIGGGVLAALVGLLIGMPLFRLKGDYLAIVTLGFGEIIRVVFNNLGSITNGAKGLMGIPTFPGFGGNQELAAVVMTSIAMVLAIVAVVHLMTSSHGRAILTIREDEIAAQAAGIKPFYTKLFVFVVSALLAGIAGGLYAMQIRFISPKMFDWTTSMNILIFVVFGGMGSVTGTVLATIVLTFLQEELRFLQGFRLVIYALLLILMMIFRPQGLLGTRELPVTRTLADPLWWKDTWNRVRAWFSRRGKGVKQNANS